MVSTKKRRFKSRSPVFLRKLPFPTGVVLQHVVRAPGVIVPYTESAFTDRGSCTSLLQLTKRLIDVEFIILKILTSDLTARVSSENFCTVNPVSL